ncbi:hypothetical protein B0T25DRAFT_561657 [Lasiosphaeria hispida]|uniref:Uncharacterized protein n=1 Tax=Lasiosphaeria hispida TaxID=260671 RepID=A0AAJ0HTH6_9PEZI|nr:hypothetical protein B0T25DRAFT_561657 [Lasiosphaeria hispida]
MEYYNSQRSDARLTAYMLPCNHQPAAIEIGPVKVPMTIMARETGMVYICPRKREAVEGMPSFRRCCQCKALVSLVEEENCRHCCFMHPVSETGDSWSQCRNCRVVACSHEDGSVRDLATRAGRMLGELDETPNMWLCDDCGCIMSFGEGTDAFRHAQTPADVI